MQLLLGEVEAGGVDVIELKRKDVVGLRKQVKINFSVKLSNVDASDLTVHQTPDSEALDEEAAIPDAKTKATRLYIKAPAQEFVPGENPTNPLFTTNVLSTTDLLCLFLFPISTLNNNLHRVPLSMSTHTHSSRCPNDCVLTYPHVLQLVREELQVRIPTITIVCVCQFMFSTISPLSPPPRTALNVSSPQSRFLSVFVSSF